jgi:hypothetical protein
MTNINMMLHSDYLRVLPEINATKFYGEATKIIRDKLDRHFNKETDGQLKLFKVTGEYVTRADVETKVEATSEEEAFDLAREKFEIDRPYDAEIEMWSAQEIK